MEYIVCKAPSATAISIWRPASWPSWRRRVSSGWARPTLGHRNGRQHPKEQLDFMPSRRRRGAHVRRWQIPGGFFRREGGRRRRHPHGKAGRPTAAPSSPGPAQRDPRGRHHPVDRHGEPLRRAAINGASAAVQRRHPLSGAVGAVRLGRKETTGLSTRPTRAGGVHLRHGRGRPPTRPAGRHPHGRGRSHRARRPLGGDRRPQAAEERLGLALELAKSHIATACQLQAELVRRPGRQARSTHCPEYGEDVAGAVRGNGRTQVREAITIADKAQREVRSTSSRPRPSGRHRAAWRGAGGREKEACAAFRSRHQELVRQRVVKEAKRIDGRGRATPAAEPRSDPAPGPRLRAVPAWARPRC